MTTRYVDPFPYKGGIFRSGTAEGEGGGGGATGIWYAYFETTPIDPGGGEPQVITLGGIGTAGNAELFESVGDGVKFKSGAIVQATAWGTIAGGGGVSGHDVEDAGKWLGIQLDKGGTLLTRAHTAFNQKAANITYGGVLAVDDILRVVGGNEAAESDAIHQGWVSVIATPIS